MTPRAISAGVSRRILLAAPRILKAPMGCRLSALSQTSPETPGKGARKSGVRMAMEAMRAAAARISSRETSVSVVGDTLQLAARGFADAALLRSSIADARGRLDSAMRSNRRSPPGQVLDFDPLAQSARLLGMTEVGRELRSPTLPTEKSR